MSAALPALSFVVGVIGQIKQSKAARKAEKEADKAKKVDAAIASRENSRRRRAAIREARIQRGEVISAGGNQNVLGSSGVQGGAGSVVSQGAANIHDINETEALSQRRNMFLSSAAEAQSDANSIGAFTKTFQSALSIGSSVANQYSSFKNSEAGQQNTFLNNNPSFKAATGKKNNSFFPSFNNTFGR